jgi:nucleotide-binding universal stress UspA family protein
MSSPRRILIATDFSAGILLGSVAERIVRRSTCPVLTVPLSGKAA